MIEDAKVGCAITTYNRPAQLRRLYDSLPLQALDLLVIVNDGEPFATPVDWPGVVFIQNDRNLGVAKSKNRGIDALLDADVDHCFLVEDDIFVRDPTVFARYIEVSRITGIQHLNFSQHGNMNKTAAGAPCPRIEVEYPGELRVPFFPHCVGAFSYYSRRTLLDVGGMDETFYNALEHVDHTWRVIQAGQHPPFWYFADIPQAERFLGDEEWSLAQSTISSRTDRNVIAMAASRYFLEKHDVPVEQIALATTDELAQSLQAMMATYGR